MSLSKILKLKEVHISVLIAGALIIVGYFIRGLFVVISLDLNQGQLNFAIGGLAFGFLTIIGLLITVTIYVLKK